MASSDETGPYQPREGPEADMFSRVRAGEEFDPGALGSGSLWREDQTIQAEALRHLLVDKGLKPRGVQLRHVRVSGQLDLRSATLSRPLQLRCCLFEEPVILDYAKVSLLIFKDCVLAGLNGDTLVVTKGLELTGSTFTKPVLLPDARVHGHFRCTGAKLTGVINDPKKRAEYGGSYALIGDGMQVSGDVRLDENFRAGNEKPNADAEKPNAEKEKFEAKGVLLSGAHIGGTMDCTGAKLTAAEATADSEKNYCFRGSGLRVDGDAIFNRCTTEDNGIRLSDASIAGELLCHGTQLKGADKGGNALRANDLRVGGNVFFINEFTADGGKISLGQAVIGGNLEIKPKRLGADKDGIAFNLAGTQVTQRLVWCPDAQIHGRVILERMVIGQLEDCWTTSDGRRRHNGYWPTDGNLCLDGLIYNRIYSVPDGDVSVDDRLEWIRSQYASPAKIRAARKDRRKSEDGPTTGPARFAAQPYRQLADVYRGAGRNAAARTAAIAQRRDLRDFGNLTKPAKFGNWLLDNTIRYGYRTWHAAIALAILYAAVAGFFFVGRSHEAIIAVQATPNPPSATSSSPRATSHTPSASPDPGKCTASYPCFNPFGYAIDTVIPIINVHQAEFWGPNAHAKRPWDWLSVWVTYVSTGLGWLFATLAVAGYTGLARNASSP